MEIAFDSRSDYVAAPPASKSSPADTQRAEDHVVSVKAAAPRVLIVDDHPAIRGGVRALLDSDVGKWIICGEASNGNEAVQKAKQLKPDMVVLDVLLPDLGGPSVLRQIRDVLPNVRALVFSMLDSELNIREMLGAGAAGYVLKSDEGIEVLSALKAIREGKTYLSRRVSDIMISGYVDQFKARMRMSSDDPTSTLTPRQIEIVRYLANGKVNKEIAEALKLSVKTVEAHRAQIMGRLRLHSLGELVRFAVRSGIVQD